MRKLAMGYFDEPAGFVPLGAEKPEPSPNAGSEMLGAEQPAGQGKPEAGSNADDVVLGADQPGSEEEAPPGVKAAFEASFLAWEKGQSHQEKAAICARSPATAFLGMADGGDAELSSMQQGLLAYVLRKHFAGVAELQAPFRQIYGEDES